MFITGDLTQDTVMSALAQSIKLLARDSHYKVNLSAVGRCDSASLAFLTALMREGKSKGTQLQFNHLPMQMLQIGKVSGLIDILPIAES